MLCYVRLLDGTDTTTTWRSALREDATPLHGAAVNCDMNWLFLYAILARDSVDLVAPKDGYGCGKGGGLLEKLRRCADSRAAVSSADAIELLPLLLQLPRNGEAGTFVEIGANDGMHMSNTWMLERCFNWNGLLVEASPPTFGRLQQSNRSAAMLHSATCSQGGTVNFTTTDGPFSVLNMAVNQVDDKFLRRWAKHVDTARTVAVPCSPLGELMSRQRLERVNFLSLDTQARLRRASAAPVMPPLRAVPAARAARLTPVTCSPGLGGARSGYGRPAPLRHGARGARARQRRGQHATRARGAARRGDGAAAAGCEGQGGEERAVRQAGSSARRAPKPEQVIREECKEQGGHRVRQRAAAGGGSRGSARPFS